jgi:hypothetical protein
MFEVKAVSVLFVALDSFNNSMFNVIRRLCILRRALLSSSFRAILRELKLRSYEISVQL